MKKVFFGSALVLCAALASCTSETTVTEGGENTEEQAPTAMTCQDIENQKDELKGKEVTVKAFSWGNSNTMDGDVRMNLGDKKLEGMAQAHVIANFSPDNAEAADAVKKDDEVTIKATVGDYEYGAVHLTNPEIVK